MNSYKRLKYCQSCSKVDVCEEMCQRLQSDIHQMGRAFEYFTGLTDYKSSFIEKINENFYNSKLTSGHDLTTQGG